MKNKVSITVNGVERSAEVEPRMLLVHFLREELHLTGTHVGCDTTQCGACTVRMNEQAVKSCTVFAVQADGANITTVEGLAGGEALHPIQEAFREHHGLQCGFCTPGMMMAASQLLDRYPEPTLEQIKHQLDGNICRCTGYHNIIKAVQSAAEKIKARKQAQGVR
ncbi:MAG: (2Fe-2S)-binding protein [Xanthobacteraceae bacterium]|nr:(2Fe-2S)-binding protein [Xanthobacteraceae bacterium]